MICIKTLARTQVLFNPAIKHGSDTRQDLAHPEAAKDGPGMQKPIKKGLYSATSVYFQEGVQVASSLAVYTRARSTGTSLFRPMPSRTKQIQERLLFKKGALASWLWWQSLPETRLVGWNVNKFRDGQMETDLLFAIIFLLPWKRMNIQRRSVFTWSFITVH